MTDACSPFQDLIVDEGVGELSPDDARRLLAHVEGCAVCREERARLKKALLHTRSLFVPEPADAYWEGFVPRLKTRISTSKDGIEVMEVRRRLAAMARAREPLAPAPRAREAAPPAPLVPLRRAAAARSPFFGEGSWGKLALAAGISAVLTLTAVAVLMLGSRPSPVVTAPSGPAPSTAPAWPPSAAPAAPMQAPETVVADLLPDEPWTPADAVLLERLRNADEDDWSGQGEVDSLVEDLSAEDVALLSSWLDTELQRPAQRDGSAG